MPLCYLRPQTPLSIAEHIGQLVLSTILNSTMIVPNYCYQIAFSLKAWFVMQFLTNYCLYLSLKTPGLLLQKVSS